MRVATIVRSPIAISCSCVNHRPLRIHDSDSATIEQRSLRSEEPGKRGQPGGEDNRCYSRRPEVRARTYRKSYVRPRVTILLHPAEIANELNLPRLREGRRVPISRDLVEIRAAGGVLARVESPGVHRDDEDRTEDLRVKEEARHDGIQLPHRLQRLNWGEPGSVSRGGLEERGIVDQRGSADRQGSQFAVYQFGGLGDNLDTLLAYLVLDRSGELPFEDH